MLIHDIETAVFKSLSETQRDTILAASRQDRVRVLSQFLVRGETDVLKSLADSFGLALSRPEDFDLAHLGSIPARLMHEYQCVPLKGDHNGVLHLATVWPPDPEMDEWIYAASGREAQWSLASPEKISSFITKHLGVGFDSLEDSDIDLDPDMAPELEGKDDENAALVRFVNEVVQQAVHDGATDIHVEPQEDTLRIRYRVDGLLIPVPVPENLRQFQDAIISRLKIMARLNISERRLPQDGRINFKVGDNLLDIRLSTIPTMYGESVSLRLLNKKAEALTFAQIGFTADDEAQIAQVLKLPHGIVLVTGPTGSGKSTSLNAFLRSINSPEKRLITIEDPIEYEVPGVNQMQVRPEIGLSFADALRHVLRQDPDIIMVGEVRDRDTAEIAIRASLTGHLVFSTLHTNDAPGGLTRLIDMGIEPFLVASAVELIIAQRLVRRLCPTCREKKPLSASELAAALSHLQLDPLLGEGVTHMYSATGCEECRGLGYRGRLGIFEILHVNESLHDLIVGRESTRAIRRRAVEGGMLSLQHSGWLKVKNGTTTLEEVLRVTAADS
jgi:type II secretory ATPase GspE/PulE/Tfp pilus assembly ATPase PilB-like protein